jgi:hypothetical protein
MILLMSSGSSFKGHAIVAAATQAENAMSEGMKSTKVCSAE